MQKIFLLFAALIFSIAVNAQSSFLKGKITDATNNKAINGATIHVKGGGITTTDENGEFSIECKGASELIVSCINYATVTEKIKNCDDAVNIQLSPGARSLNEVEITATSNKNKSLLYQPSSLVKLDNTELKRGNGLYLEDAINENVPGVIMERRTISAGQQLNIRGYGNGTSGTRGVSSNFDGQGTKVYLNGIPVTDAEGITLMDDIDFNSIGDVEVTKGPSGTLYGLAIAGVVNLKTIQPEANKVSIGQDVMLGSYGLQRYTTHLEIGGAHSSLLVNYGKQTYDGFMKHTASHKDFVNVTGSVEANAKQTISYYFGYSNSYDQRNGELTIAQYDTNDYSGNPAYIANDAHSNIISYRAGISHTYTFNKNISRTTTVFGTGVSNNSSSAAGWTDKAPINYGLRTTVDAKFDLAKNFGLSGITGFEAQRQNASTIGYAMVPDSFNLKGYNIIGAIKSNQYTVTSNSSLFTEWTLSMPYDLSFTAGIGYSKMNIELNDRFYAASNNNPSNPNGTNKPSQYKATYNNMFSPHIAVNKVFNNNISVYASYSQAYKAPVSSYFYIPSTGQLNTNLKPEKGSQFEIGTKGSLMHSKLIYQFAAFDAQFSNKMTVVAVPNATNTATSYTYVANGGNQVDMGIEAIVKYKAYQSATGFLTELAPFANFTYSDFQYKDFKFQQLSSDKKSVVITDYSNKTVAGVPPITVNLGVDASTKIGLYGNINYSYRDKMYITSDNLYQASSYNLLNAKIGFRTTFLKHFGIDAFVGANNITGTKYYYMVFINQLPDAYLPAPAEINYFGGLNLKYTF